MDGSDKPTTSAIASDYQQLYGVKRHKPSGGQPAVPRSQQQHEAPLQVSHHQQAAPQGGQHHYPHPTPAHHYQQQQYPPGSWQAPGQRHAPGTWQQHGPYAPAYSQHSPAAHHPAHSQIYHHPQYAYWPQHQQYQWPQRCHGVMPTQHQHVPAVASAPAAAPVAGVGIPGPHPHTLAGSHIAQALEAGTAAGVADAALGSAAPPARAAAVRGTRPSAAAAPSMAHPAAAVAAAAQGVSAAAPAGPALGPNSGTLGHQSTAPPATAPEAAADARATDDEIATSAAVAALGSSGAGPALRESGGAGSSSGSGDSGGAGGSGGGSPDVVLVWDLDETLIIFNSLVSGQYVRQAAGATARGGVAVAGALAERWQDEILGLADDHLAFSQVEDNDYVSFNDLLAAAAAHERFCHAASWGSGVAGSSGCAGGGGGGGGGGATAIGRKQAALAHHIVQQLQGLYTTQMPPIAAATTAGATTSATAPASAAAPAEAAAANTGANGNAADAGGGVSAAGASAASPSPLLAKATSTAIGGSSGRGLLPHRVLCRWTSLYSDTDKFTAGWLTHAARLLEDCQAAGGGGSCRPAHAAGGTAAAEAPNVQGSRGSGGGGERSATDGAGGGGVRHVLVTNTQLVPAYAKLMLFRLAPFFRLDDVYCSRTPGKGHCFALVKQKYGPNARYHAIGDSAEEEAAARALGWAFTKICLSPPLPAPTPKGLEPLDVEGAGCKGAADPVTLLQLRAKDLVLPSPLKANMH